MTREEERALGEGVEQAWQSIRLRACQVGPAAQWHLGKARAMLRDPAQQKRPVLLRNREEEAAYFAGLPPLVQQTEDQDARCASLWAVREVHPDRTEFDRERERLVGLFFRLQFTYQTYERLVRQEPKPLLDTVRKALADMSLGLERLRDLEGQLRMSLQGYIDHEGAIDQDLRALDRLRAELVAAHEEFAREVAAREGAREPDALFYARCGLRRAAEYYEVSRGFRFAPYAIWWIRQAIAARSTWGRTRESLG